MLRRNIALLGLSASVFTILLSAVPLVNAQQATQQSTGNALKISPVRTDLEIKAGEAKSIDVYVQNMTSSSTKLRGIINDFVAGKDENGTPNIILDADQAAPTHSLKQYIAPIGEFTLQPNEQKSIKVTISIPKDAAAGGYFGAVRFAPVSSDNNQNVTLSASVGSLVLVKVPGDIREDLQVASLDVRRADKAGTFFTSGRDLKAVVRFQNNGDAQEAPFGKIILKKGVKTLGTYEINDVQPRGNVLPDSIRRFSVDLTNVGSFGKYRLEGNFGYGSNGQLITASHTFYVVPVSVLIVTSVVLLLVVMTLFVVPKWIARYNDHVVRKAAGHGSSVKPAKKKK